MMTPCATTALIGPNADAEALILGLLNRQDRYVLRRTCQARRRELGARTTTLVLSEDAAGEAVLHTVDLAASFPSLRKLVLRCKEAAQQGWPERLATFVSRNQGALAQLQHLDLDRLDRGALCWAVSPLRRPHPLHAVVAPTDTPPGRPTPRRPSRSATACPT